MIGRVDGVLGVRVRARACVGVSYMAVTLALDRSRRSSLNVGVL